MKINFSLLAIIGTVFTALILLFIKGLNNNPNTLEFTLQGQKVPSFSLPELSQTRNANTMLTHNDLVAADNTYYIINFWGSWCIACHREHTFLMSLRSTETVYGVNWKDETTAALSFLNKYGNPFTRIIIDQHSELAIGMGVSGAPETFLVAANGDILQKHAGVLSKRIWEEKFLPAIQSLQP